MSDDSPHINAPCIVNEGTLINKKDMTRALDTLENVRYVYTVDGKEISQGQGIVVKVYANRKTSTLIVNGCVFLNVLSFDFLRFAPNEKGVTEIELVEDAKVLKLIPFEEESKRFARTGKELLAGARVYEDEENQAIFDDLYDEDDD